LGLRVLLKQFIQEKEKKYFFIKVARRVYNNREELNNSPSYWCGVQKRLALGLKLESLGVEEQ